MTKYAFLNKEASPSSFITPAPSAILSTAARRARRNEEYDQRVLAKKKLKADAGREHPQSVNREAYFLEAEHIDSLDVLVMQISKYLGIQAETLHSAAQEPLLAISQIRTITDVVESLFQTLRTQVNSFLTIPSVYTILADDRRHLSAIIQQLEGGSPNWTAIMSMAASLRPIPGLTEYDQYYWLHQLTERDLLQDPTTIATRLQLLGEVVGMSPEQINAAAKQIFNLELQTAQPAVLEEVAQQIARLEPALRSPIDKLTNNQQLRDFILAYIGGDLDKKVLSARYQLLRKLYGGPVSLRIRPEFRPLMLIIGCAGLIFLLFLTSCNSTPTPAGAEPINTVTPVATAVSAPTHLTAEPSPTPTQKPTPEVNPELKTKVEAYLVQLNVMNQDLRSHGVPLKLSVSSWEFSGRAVLLATNTQTGGTGGVGLVDLNTSALITTSIGTVPLASMQPTSRGLGVVDSEGQVHVFGAEEMRWTEYHENKTFFETAPLTLQEVAEIFDFARHTEIMSGTAHTGAQVHILVDFTQVGPNGAPIVPPQYRLSRIDYMPDGPDGQPNNDAVAQYNVEAMASMQRQANAIDRDGRSAPSTAPNPGEEEISVVNIAELSGQKGRLAPKLQRIKLAVDDPSIKHYVFIRRFAFPNENDAAGYVRLGSGTDGGDGDNDAIDVEVRLHMHGGATGGNSYTGVFLAELTNGERALITVSTVPWSDRYSEPNLFMPSLIRPGVGAVKFNSLHPDYVDRHYVVVGNPNAPIATEDIRAIRATGTTLDELSEIFPKLTGQK